MNAGKIYGQIVEMCCRAKYERFSIVLNFYYYVASGICDHTFGYFLEREKMKLESRNPPLHIRWGCILEPTSLDTELFPGKLIKTLVSWKLELSG